MSDRNPPSGTERLSGDETAIAGPLSIALLVALSLTLAVVGFTFFSGIAQDESRGQGGPRVAVSVEWDAGNDSTFTGSGNGGWCLGGPASYDNDDSARITVDSGQPLNTSNVDIRIENSSGVYSPTEPWCMSGSGTSKALDWDDNPPERFTAGVRYEIYEGQNSNAIEPGATLRIVWHDPESDESYLLVEETVPDM